MKTTITIEEIRRSNLLLLIAEEGTATAVAAKSGTTPSYLSQIQIRYKMKSGKTREIGTTLARKLEAGCGKPEGWMDVRHDDIDPNESELVHLYSAMNDEMRALVIQHAKMILNTRKN